MLGDNYPVFNNDEIAKEAIRTSAYNHLKKAIKRYGLEGTEDTIKRVYINQKTRDYLLEILHEIWKGKQNE